MIKIVTPDEVRTLTDAEEQALERLHNEIVQGLIKGQDEGPGAYGCNVPQPERQRAARVLASRLRATGWQAEFRGEWLRVNHPDLA
jgi:hypothetical protein